MGDVNERGFKAAEKAITDVWGEAPLRVREGGTMPITPFLVDTLKAPAIHIPLGDSCVRLLLLSGLIYLLMFSFAYNFLKFFFWCRCILRFVFFLI